MYSLNAIITRPDTKKTLMDYINQEIINNPKYYKIESILEKVNEILEEPISRTTLERLIKQEGIIKDKQKKCFVYSKDYEKEVNKKWFVKLIKSNITSVFSYTQPSSLYSKSYKTLVLSVKPSKENLVCELIMEYFELDKDYHIMIGKHCITISSLIDNNTVHSNYDFIQNLEIKIERLLNTDVRSLD
ncbi:hypothetical protein HMPREF9402_2869 [Turicibacter sp. HGF1]|uniref:hypothetical protein n=1 Tax=Turicibacter sp. HGF1 TaxID=910310 RepID=UPI0001FD7FF1|nr:hypothetical protein [Turicibacter sp. HGF1]EGC92671.1 hypothetical protein HMPREF9402_2869 [Turicibacter sp. HGF1]